MYELIQMSFDGEYVRDSVHNTLDEAIDTSADLGSKWYFYPFSIVTTGKSRKIVSMGGSICYIPTGQPVLESIFRGKQLKTVARYFAKVASEIPDGEDFEQYIIEREKR